VVQPKSTVILCGNRAFARDGLDSDKKVKDEALASLIASELWKEEKKKKEKK
jgi:hypothetical protein